MAPPETPLIPNSFSPEADARIRSESSPEKQDLAAFQWLSRLLSDLEKVDEVLQNSVLGSAMHEGIPNLFTDKQRI
jgi:hypothetical protein